MHFNYHIFKKMKISSILLFAIICLVSFTASSAIKHDSFEAFLQCIEGKNSKIITANNYTYTQSNTNYTSLLQGSKYNLRFTTSSTPKPLAIFTPFQENEIPPIIYCSKKHGLRIRVRSGGHDFEGLSYTSRVPFVILDMINLRSVHVDFPSRTAWVQSGATIGELYYQIAKKSRTLGFPGATCSTVGAGGYFSGGGYGAMMRKHGLAVDNVIDAKIINANGRILDRKSMGEDLFWAIRGGGGGSFGVVLSWKVKLVPVPEKVTVFRIVKTLEENVTVILHRWQYVAPKIHKDLFLTTSIRAVNISGISTIRVSFVALFLGGKDKLLPLMQKSFRELGVKEEDCIEMSWIRSVFYFMGITTEQPLELLLNRALIPKTYFYAKSDYVQVPMSVKALDGLLKLLKDGQGTMSFTPYGGKMNEISDSALPFPHRAGNLYKILYNFFWNEESKALSRSNLKWIRRIYKYATPYVSKSPRGAYINYRDLDLGVNNNDKAGNTSFAKASIWGAKYFKNNFPKLAKVKTLVDPTNFFSHQQSIPLFSP